MSGLNPNAFTFNPNASSFVPGQFGSGSWDSWESAAWPPAEAENKHATSQVESTPATTTPSQPDAPSPAPAEILKPDPVPATPKPTPAPATPSIPVASDDTTDDRDDDFDDDEDGESRETRKERRERLEAEADAELEAKDDPREHLCIVFIGHVDAGKSTISGRVLLNSGMVDERTIQKYEREAIEKNRSSWYLAYIMDTNEEERRKGKTVEVGRAHFTTERKRYTILDAPGHKGYVPNMIAGVAQADIGVLVISARKGEFEAGFQKSGQTREHVILAKTLGITRLVIVVNKMDDPSVNWSKDRYDEIYNNISQFIKTIGYSQKDVTWIPISGINGDNLTFRSEACPWYSGPHLIEVLDSLSPLERMDQLPLRIPVLDKYKEAGKTFILGKVETGVLRNGDDILVRPGDMKINVAQLQNDTNIITVAKPGEMVRIVCKISQVDEDAISKGCVIQHVLPTLCPVTDEFVAQLVILELPVDDNVKTADTKVEKLLFTAGFKSVLHIHTATEEVEVLLLLEELDGKTGKIKTRLPKFVKEKSVVVCHMKAARALPIEAFKDFSQLGRFTLRDKG